MDLDPTLLAAVKGFEGFTPKAEWDYRQHSNGYGTKAASPGEVIDRETADQRLQSELGKAQAQVTGFAPNAPPGAQRALTSLTFNAGPGWMDSGLGQAVKAGDWPKAQTLFLQYNKAGGQEVPGLNARRQQEASWFGGQPAPFQTIPAAAAPAGIGLFGPQMVAGASAGQQPSGSPQGGSAALGSFFAQMPAGGAQAAPMPLMRPPQLPPLDLGRLQAFLASQQINLPGQS